MELKEGEYFVPDGFTAKIVGRTVRVYKAKRAFLAEGEYRCKDCKHYVRGFSGGYWETNVCFAKPKGEDKLGRKVYYAAQKYGMPCEKFEVRV